MTLGSHLFANQPSAPVGTLYNPIHQELALLCACFVYVSSEIEGYCILNKSIFTRESNIKYNTQGAHHMFLQVFFNSDRNKFPVLSYPVEKYLFQSYVGKIVT